MPVDPASTVLWIQQAVLQQACQVTMSIAEVDCDCWITSIGCWQANLGFVGMVHL